MTDSIPLHSELCERALASVTRTEGFRDASAKAVAAARSSDCEVDRLVVSHSEVTAVAKSGERFAVEIKP